jgi:hypothetical protein
VLPRIGAVHLQRLNEPQLLKLYGTLLAEGRIKRDGNSAMFAYWSDRTAEGDSPEPREVALACDTTIHAVRAAVRRYRPESCPSRLLRAWRRSPYATSTRLSGTIGSPPCSYRN